jgi:hypothetical protein
VVFIIKGWGGLAYLYLLRRRIRSPLFRVIFLLLTVSVLSGGLSFFPLLALSPFVILWLSFSFWGASF